MVDIGKGKEDKLGLSFVSFRSNLRKASRTKKEIKEDKEIEKLASILNECKCKVCGGKGTVEEHDWRGYYTVGCGNCHKGYTRRDTEFDAIKEDYFRREWASGQRYKDMHLR